MRMRLVVVAALLGNNLMDPSEMEHGLVATMDKGSHVVGARFLHSDKALCS